MSLPRAHLQLLKDFAAAGGSGTLDIQERVCAGPTAQPMPGQPGMWLRLVAEGLVAGEYGKILLTEAGRELAR